MAESRTATAREQGAIIKEALENAKLKMVALTHDVVSDGGTTLPALEKQRRIIEALEYALTCVPPPPARLGRVVLG